MRISGDNQKTECNVSKFGLQEALNKKFSSDSPHSFILEQK
jgi:hypothetical protein